MTTAGINNKKGIALISVLCILIGAITIVTPTVKAAGFEAGVLIEAEDGTISNTMQVRDSSSASGRKCIVNMSGPRLDNPSVQDAPDATYIINIPTSGKYQILMRYSAPSDGSDSFHYRWDSGTWVSPGVKSVPNTWGWFTSATSLTTLSAGNHTLSITHRENGMIIDAFIITRTPASIDTAAIDAQIMQNSTPTSPPAAENSTAKILYTQDGVGVIEAEDCTLTPGIYTTGSEAAASGGRYVTAQTTTQTTPTPDMAGLEFNFDISKTGIYSVWIRYSVINGGQDSIWASLDGAAYDQPSYIVTGTNQSDYGWIKLVTTGTVLAGTKHNFKLYPREGGSRMDKFIVTSYATYAPTGMGDISDMSTKLLPGDKYPMPTITPPPTHPRLLFTAADIPTIKSNMQKGQNSVAVSEFNTQLTKDYDGNLSGSLLDNASNYAAGILTAIEAWAFKYAIDGDESYGYKAINAMKKYLETCTFDTAQQDVTRVMGHTIFVAAEVYDWCYPLLTPLDKTIITLNCESVAAGMEVNYPPSAQGAICGHAGEAQLLRDLVSLGIATYDERPDIYNYVGGRLLSQFVETRNYWYTANTYHQGNAYGAYRYSWDVIFGWIIYRMTGGDNSPNAVKLFSSEQQNVPLQWFYDRRGDGQIMRNGDDYNEGGTTATYWTPHAIPLFYAANFWGNAYLKGEYDIENPAKALSNNSHSLTGVHYILFNDPELVGNQNKNELPLTKYFASPDGIMVARTGWDTDPSNPAAVDDVVARMKIGELWGANHEHLDAGNFQIYYKGILASESGYYEAYGTRHDGNYNKRSIAHNVLTVYDPTEEFASYRPAINTLPASMKKGFNDGGQKFPNGGGEPATWDVWQNGNYKTGTVLDHEFGPDPMTPAYSYIRGDITPAYSSKVSEVKRAMAFLPLDDINYPAMMVVMDKVTSTNQNYKKKFLLHMQDEPILPQDDPALSANTAIVKRVDAQKKYNGKLTVQTLLPKNASITKVGGEDKAFWVGNQAGDFLNDGENLAPINSTQDTNIEAGWGRIEISPATPAQSDKFLNVMAVSDGDNNAVPLDSVLIESNNLVGVKTAGKVVMFSDVSGTARSRLESTASFSVPGSEPELDVLVTGVKEGRWTVQVNGSTVAAPTATVDGGSLYFKAPAGAYTLTYNNTSVVDLPITIKPLIVTGKAAGASVPIRCEIAGNAQGGKVVFVVYNKNGALDSISVQDYTGSRDYSFSYALPQNYSGMSFKIFVWGSDMITPLGVSQKVMF